jgi:hypothetical protein
MAKNNYSSKPFWGLSVIASLTAVLVLSVYVTNNPKRTQNSQAVKITGSGAPNGAHFNLNVIGVPKNKTVSETDFNSQGRRIFVKLYGNTIINLAEGDFGVIDYNGTDGTAAFQLPNPDVNCDGTTEYSVFVRALGTPKGSATFQSCYIDGATGENWCAVDFADGVADINLTRTKGKQTFTNVSKDLLYVDYCSQFDQTTGECLKVVQVPLFGGGDDITKYFWEDKGEGLKLAQFRFYQGYETATGWVPVCNP